MKSTTRFNKNKKGIECLNCSQPISTSDNFCSNCGQVNDELPLSIKQFVSEFFAGFFSFDSRFFKTFFPLIFKPGKVSKDYIEGKRRKYVNPFQLYLHVTILFFLVQGLFAAIDEYKISDNTKKEEAIEVEKDSINNDSDKNLKKDSIITNLNNSLVIDSNTQIDSTENKQLSKKEIAFNKNSNFIKSLVDSTLQNSNLILQLKDSTITKAEKDSLYQKYFEKAITDIVVLVTDGEKNTQDWNEIQKLSKLKDVFTTYTEEQFENLNIDYSPPKKTKQSFEDQMFTGLIGNKNSKKVSEFMKYDKDNPDSTPIEALEALNYEKTRWNIFYYKKAQDFNKFKEDESFRQSYYDDIVSKISVALFFMLPIFTLFLSLLYIRKKLNYTEHLVFVFNVQTVFFLLLLFFIVLNRFINMDSGWIITIFILVFLFYLYKSLRNFYKQNRFKTIIKYWLLNIIFLTLSSIFFVAISFLAFAL